MKFSEYLLETKLTSLHGINKGLRMKLNFFLKKLGIEAKEITDFGSKLRIELNSKDEFKILKPYLDASDIKVVKHFDSSKNVIFISK